MANRSYCIQCDIEDIYALMESENIVGRSIV